MHGKVFCENGLVDSSITANPRFERNFRSYTVETVPQGESKKGVGQWELTKLLFTHINEWKLMS